MNCACSLRRFFHEHPCGAVATAKLTMPDPATGRA
jgi:hypothetical protein